MGGCCSDPNNLKRCALKEKELTGKINTMDEFPEESEFEKKLKRSNPYIYGWLPVIIGCIAFAVLSWMGVFK